MSRPLRWVSPPVALAIHDELIVQFGGLTGLRDEGLLLSALVRPEQTAHGRPDCASLAAIYAVSIAKNRAFTDGNKRTAFSVAATFLELNGFLLSLPEPEAVILTLDIAKGKIEEHEVAAILRSNCSPIEERAP